MPLLTEVQEAWRANGKLFGYPQCCIDWFVERSSKIYSLPTMEEILKAAEVLENQRGYSHGFIPCPECARKVTPGTEGSLITNRLCPTPYPDDSGTGQEWN